MVATMEGTTTVEVTLEAMTVGVVTGNKPRASALSRHAEPSAQG